MKARLGVVVLSMLGLSACTSNDVTRAAYEAAYQKECIDRTGAADCDPEHKTYEEYNKDRAEQIQQAP